jgi:hypothetical protein
MTYTDDQILDLMGVLDTVGHSETPNEELKRLLREWEPTTRIYQMEGKSPTEIHAIQLELLGVIPDGIYGPASKDAAYRWSTASFYLWLKSKGKVPYILEVGGTSSISGKYMVLHKDCAACFRRRNVFPKSESDILEAGYSYHKIWDEIPPGLGYPKIDSKGSSAGPYIR